jgi:cytochrome b6-f complex iron-sulfur subunit
MPDERIEHRGDLTDGLPSVGQIARTDAYLDRLVADRMPGKQEAAEAGLAERMIAAQLRLAVEGVEVPSPAFLERLEKNVAAAAAAGGRAHARRDVSRGSFLRRIATLAGGVGLGVAGVEGVIALQGGETRPQTLVAAGTGRWYDIAAADEVPLGGMKPFVAGGLLGFLVNDGGNLHAVSAICTHMGCRLKPVNDEQGPANLGCLCHNSTFARTGDVLTGLAPSALPRIDVLVQGGRVLALGTHDTV